ncbi:8900_t:CDS:2, partial [Racocetra persica]
DYDKENDLIPKFNKKSHLVQNAPVYRNGGSGDVYNNERKPHLVQNAPAYRNDGSALADTNGDIYNNERKILQDENKHLKKQNKELENQVQDMKRLLVKKDKE